VYEKPSWLNEPDGSSENPLCFNLGNPSRAVGIINPTLRYKSISTIWRTCPVAREPTGKDRSMETGHERQSFMGIVQQVGEQNPTQKIE
jgi:hypothetical protein